METTSEGGTGSGKRPTAAEIEVLAVTDCPHCDLMVNRVRQALDRLGAAQGVVTVRRVDDPDDAAAAGMHGSPTVLVDGRDPFAAAGSEASVSCRLYPTATGVEGAPGVDDLVTALSGHVGSA